MIEWTEIEFQRVAQKTKLSNRTLEACKAVLVDNVLGVDAAVTYGMFPAQISRALTLLRDKREKMMTSAKELQNEDSLLRFTAAEIAKQIVGDGLVIEDAQYGKDYVGKKIIATHGFLVQKVGRIGVIHDMGNLEKIPNSLHKDAILNILYPVNSGKAVVVEKNDRPVHGLDVGR